jgi:hypothetical protein
LLGEEWKDYIPNAAQSVGMMTWKVEHWLESKRGLSRPNVMLKPDPLARELVQFGLLNRFGGESAWKLTPLIAERDTTTQDWKNVSAKDVIDVANTLYYVAKNTVYREPNYFHEMSRIRMRIDFARSFSFVSVILIIIALILYILRLIEPLIPKKVLLFLRLSWLPNIRLGTVSVKVCGIILLLLSACIIGSFAFQREEAEYYRRAYGYFITISRAETKSAEVNPTQPVNLSLVKQLIVKYHDSGEWNSDLRTVTSLVTNYLRDRIATGKKWLLFWTLTTRPFPHGTLLSRTILVIAVQRLMPG